METVKSKEQSLTQPEIPSFLDTSSGDLITDFFVPVLTRFVRFDRAVGYFSSGWLRIATTSMVAFVANGGRARWATNPILDQDNWEAIETGDETRMNHHAHPFTAS